jgi:hypothetical protein
MRSSGRFEIFDTCQNYFFNVSQQDIDRRKAGIREQTNPLHHRQPVSDVDWFLPRSSQIHRYSLSQANGEEYWKNLTAIDGSGSLVASPLQEFEGTQSGDRLDSHRAAQIGKDHCGHGWCARRRSAS